MNDASGAVIGSEYKASSKKETTKKETTKKEMYGPIVLATAEYAADFTADSQARVLPAQHEQRPLHRRRPQSMPLSHLPIFFRHA